MKEMYETLSNRLGNALALANLTLIALNSSGLTLKLGLFTWIKFAFLLSIPARLGSAILFSEPLLPYWSNPRSLIQFSFGTLVLVYLQWVMIGFIAQRLARAIQRRQFPKPSSVSISLV